jgi:hypothetical protein
MEFSKIVIMGYTIQDHLLKQNLVYVKPRELMPLLIDKGFFSKDHKGGLPLRELLRELDRNNLLYLLPQVSVEVKPINRFWFFNPVKF